jgi:hypothetical protein
VLVRRLLLLGLAAVLLAGCELSLALDLDIERGGAGRATVTVALDDELERILDDAGVDVLAGLDAIAERDPAWDAAVDRPEEGGLTVRFDAAFEDTAELRDLLDGFHGELDPDHDPRIFEDLRVESRPGGGVALEGRVGLLPPSTPGARGEGVGFDEEALEELVAERGDEFVRYDVRVTLPTDPAEHDADEVDGASLVWHAPVGELRPIAAVSERPPPPTWVVATLVALGAAVVVGLVAAVWRRRTRAPNDAV